MGETAHIRDKVRTFIRPGDCGIDVGFGGETVAPNTITIDQAVPYQWSEESHPQHLVGDARSLHWFRDGVLDYVYSSHLLEDFPPNETEAILREWLRVLKSGGRLMLYLPNEKIYRAHCEATGQSYNPGHSNLEMSANYMVGVFANLGLRDVEAWEPVPDPGYSFLIVGTKL